MPENERESSHLVDGEYIYVSDFLNQRVQSFLLTNTTDFLNGTTAFDLSSVPSNRSAPLFPSGLAYDKKQAVLYVGDYLNQRLILLNRTINSTEIVADTSIGVSPAYILVDDKTDVFYVTDTISNSVFRFEVGTDVGRLVAGDSMSDSMINQLASPMGLALDSSGYLYIADAAHNRIVQVLNDQGDLRTIAGEIVFPQVQGIFSASCNISTST